MKPRALMIAYACDPEGTGEHWLGWGWAEQAARVCKVDLITTPRAREAVSAACGPLGITPHFVSGPAWLRAATEAAGGGWLRKFAWQKRVAKLAAMLHEAGPFQVVHQTTFHTFRIPFLAARLGVPAVWGPIAGGEHVPAGFSRYLGRAKYSEAARQFSNRLWLNHVSVRRSLRDAAALFVSNRTTLEFLPAWCHGKAQIVPANALRAEDETQAVPAPKRTPVSARPFKLLYVGNCVATRAIPLVFEALRKSGLESFEFSVVGSGPAIGAWKRRAAELNLGANVTFVGQVPYTQLGRFYNDADVLAFPALRDSGGSALLEAMSRFLPVICLDWGGPGEMLDERSGIKVPVTTPEATVQAFAEAIMKLQRDNQLRESLAAAAQLRARDLFSWQAKGQVLEATYRRLMGK